jgi:hypothetical protein
MGIFLRVKNQVFLSIFDSENGTSVQGIGTSVPIPRPGLPCSYSYVVTRTQSMFFSFDHLPSRFTVLIVFAFHIR